MWIVGYWHGMSWLVCCLHGATRRLLAWHMAWLVSCWHGMAWLVGMACRLLAWYGVVRHLLAWYVVACRHGVARRLLAWHVVARRLLAWLVGMAWLAILFAIAVPSSSSQRHLVAPSPSSRRLLEWHGSSAVGMAWCGARRLLACCGVARQPLA